MLSRKLFRDGDIWTGSWRISRRMKVGEGDMGIPSQELYLQGERNSGDDRKVQLKPLYRSRGVAEDVLDFKSLDHDAREPGVLSEGTGHGCSDFSRYLWQQL